MPAKAGFPQTQGRNVTPQRWRLLDHLPARMMAIQQGREQ
jgi:hypothetical protein